MDGRDPLSPDEYLLRRVTAFKYDDKSPFPIPPDHFNPRQGKDEDGISFFQESTNCTPQKLADFSNKHGWIIARVKVGELKDIGLTPTPTNGEGHVSIPELKYADFKSKPAEVDRLKKDLARLIADRIVLRTQPASP
jgi:hypothetical protein